MLLLHSDIPKRRCCLPVPRRCFFSISLKSVFILFIPSITATMFVTARHAFCCCRHVQSDVASKIWRRGGVRRHCATIRKVADSIPKGIFEILHWTNPSGLIMAVGSTRPRTEMSTGNLLWEVKLAGAGADNVATFMCRLSENPGSLSLLEPCPPN